jgi:hypothetical protein
VIGNDLAIRSRTV